MTGVQTCALPILDRVLAPEKMGRQLLQRFSDGPAPAGLATLLDLVQRTTGVDFHGYKEETLQRRLYEGLLGRQFRPIRQSDRDKLVD